MQSIVHTATYNFQRSICMSSTVAVLVWKSLLISSNISSRQVVYIPHHVVNDQALAAATTFNSFACYINKLYHKSSIHRKNASVSLFLHRFWHFYIPNCSEFWEESNEFIGLTIRDLIHTWASISRSIYVRRRTLKIASLPRSQIKP